jgi:alpha-mannosidase
LKNWMKETKSLWKDLLLNQFHDVLRKSKSPLLVFSVFILLF